MKTFIKHYRRLLPYKKIEYLSHLENDFGVGMKWHGISIQSIEHKDDSVFLLEFCTVVFEKLIHYYDKGSKWIISHDDKDMPWFYKAAPQRALPVLRTLFLDHSVPIDFKGGIRLTTTEILGDLLNNIVAYPFTLSYKNLDVSHLNIPLVIKIRSHLCIDVLTTDTKIIDQLKKMRFSLPCRMIPYKYLNQERWSR